MKGVDDYIKIGQDKLKIILVSKTCILNKKEI